MEQKFNSRVIAKHKHKKQRTAGGGFHIDSNLNEEVGDVEDEDEDEDDEDGEDDEEMGDAEVGSRAKENGAGPAEKRQPGPKRRRRRQWLRDGDNNFAEMPAVQNAIAAKLGPEGKKLSDGRLRAACCELRERARACRLEHAHPESNKQRRVSKVGRHAV